MTPEQAKANDKRIAALKKELEKAYKLHHALTTNPTPEVVDAVRKFNAKESTMTTFKEYLNEAETPQAKPSPNLSKAIEQANCDKKPELKYSIMDGKPMAIYSRPRDHEMTALKYAAKSHNLQFNYDNDKDIAVLKDTHASQEFTKDLKNGKTMKEDVTIELDPSDAARLKRYLYRNYIVHSGGTGNQFTFDKETFDSIKYNLGDYNFKTIK